MEKKYYITKKSVNKYIKSVGCIYKDKADLKADVKKVIADLNEYPDSNKNQIKFFTRVLAIL
jgi:uncharacterized protein (UPF0335 family)